ncbi:cell cycle checkpoint protein [Geosmithia morbida]|uniref:Cell cycle checkpoint protein n=1 Tax=Geosmithia morbida TaxID=1094350 RepID=A0A9P4YX59_9HYPO|nr:cell cycle checkpoint protein [Geosmithia morbida]KAF4123414.1 cell cycle checkpoint protein [Geosmithia morbida]
MSGILSHVPIVNRLAGSGSRPGMIELPPVEIHQVETSPDRRARGLKHLIKANHVNYSIVYRNYGFDNHNAQILSSAYLLGADETKLAEIYEARAEVLEPWQPSPAEVIDEDWDDFVGDRRYQRAYIDYFEDKLALEFAYDWKKEVSHFMFDLDEPLFHGLIGGLGHPLVHLGYAYEVDSRELAMEALALTAIEYNFLHKYISDRSYTRSSPIQSDSPMDLIGKLVDDERFDSIKNQNLDQLESIFEQHESFIMEYWNGWKLDDPLKQFELSQEAAVALLVATAAPGTRSYNFFIAHILTTSHAVRVLLPIFPAEHRVTLVREWWLLALAIFVAKGRPKPDSENINEDIGEKGWKHVEYQALNSPWSTNAHYVNGEFPFPVRMDLTHEVKAAEPINTMQLNGLPPPALGAIQQHHSSYTTRRTHISPGTTVSRSEWNRSSIANARIALMAPPAKRRRRKVVDASDDDDDNGQHQQEDVSPLKNSNNTLANFLLASPSSPTKTRASTASPSPVKPKPRPGIRKPSKGSSSSQKDGSGAITKKSTSAKGNCGDEKGKSADLKSLFSKQAQRAPARHTDGTPVDDLISDPISEDDDDISEVKASSSSLVGQQARKRLRNSTAESSSHLPSSSAATLTTRFRKPPLSQPPVKPTNANSNNAYNDDDQRPWSERFGPKNLDELVVHKKKVADVRRWIQEVTAGRMRQRVLVLKGPAGSAKTATLRLLARDMGIEVLEWKNPANNAGLGFSSASAKFDEFLGRGAKFGALEMDDDDDGSRSGGGAAATAAVDGNEDKSKRLMMIEEFPNTFSRSSTALTSFRSSILRYLAAHVPSLNSVFSHQHKQQREASIKPIVMIISETLLTTTSAAADSFTAHRLLGPEILRHPGVGVIEFNAVAPTLLARALDLVVQKEARKSGRRRTPGPAVLQRLGEIGDVRSAISSLEFLCLKGDHEADWGAKVAFTKQKKSVRDSIMLTQGETDSLELISQREASLGIFHAVGKVVYNKREEVPSTDSAEVSLPPHMAQHARPKRSQVSVDALMDETGTDTHTFISALHENYAASCESTGPMDLSTPMDYINDCIESLSESDLLCPSRDIFFGGRGWSLGGGRDMGSHVLRQDEIMFHVAVRGMLFSLPDPVQRKMSTSFKGSDAFKMFYPQSLKLWRAKEEIEGMVDMWSSNMLKGEWWAPTRNLTDGASAFRRPQIAPPPPPPPPPPSSSSLPTTMTQQQRQRQQQQQQQQLYTDNNNNKNNDDGPLISLGSAARREMLLERLPYMAQIARRTAHGNRSCPIPIRLRDLDKVVAFKGVASVDEKAEDDEDVEEDAEQAGGGATGDADDAWATDKPSDEVSPRKKRAAGIKSGGMTGMLAQRLVLSDDDIED